MQGQIGIGLPRPSQRAYYLLRSPSAQRLEVGAFAEWLIELTQEFTTSAI